MTATAVERNTDFVGQVPGKGTLPVAADTLILKGTIVVRDALGNGDEPAAGLDAYGIASHTIDNRDGLAGDQEVNCAFGVHGLPYSGTAPKPGEVVYNVDNQTVSADSSAGTRGVAGFCTETKNGLCYFWIGPHVSGAYADLAAAEDAAEEAGAKADDLAVVEIPVPLETFRLASGAALPAFNDGVADGFALNSSEGFGYVFNVASTGVIWANVKLPDDLDEAAALEIHFLAARIGALDTTAAITVTAFGCAAGAAYDAGSNLSSGATGAIAGATKVASDVHVTANGALAGQVLSFSAVPTAALDADDMVILGCWIKCTRAVGA